MQPRSAFTPIRLSMFLYIDLASAQNRMAPSGSWMFLRSSMTKVEFLYIIELVVVTLSFRSRATLRK